MFPHDVMRDYLDSMQAIKGNLQPDEFLWFLFFCVNMASVPTVFQKCLATLDFFYSTKCAAMREILKTKTC